MSIAIEAQHEGELGAPLQRIVQEALAATETTYAGDPSINVEDALRDELHSRGVSSVNPAWAESAATSVRAGHEVAIGHDGSVG